MPVKNQFIGKLREDEEVHDTFLVLQKSISQARNGRNYLRITLGDRTGQIEARVWEGADELAKRFNAGEAVYVTGSTNSYQGVLQLKAQYIEPLEDDGKLDWSDFLPSTSRDTDEMVAELERELGRIENPYLLALVNAFMDDAEFVRGFVRSPAAKGMHHAYIGGLLEHTLGVVKLTFMMSELYPVDRDILITGAFLHDLGKMRELSPTAGFDYTLEGQLVGHLVMGRDMVREKTATIDGFPDELLVHLEHLLLSHHGQLDWGSPKTPRTLEAMALHMADNMDAKLMGVVETLAASQSDAGEWTQYQKMFDRSFYKGFGDSALYADMKEAPAPKATASPKEPEDEPEPETTGVKEDSPKQSTLF